MRTVPWTTSTLVAAVALAVASAGCSGAPTPEPPRPPEPERTSLAAAALSGPVLRSEVIANAEQWVGVQLQYCQSPNGQRDYDTSCSSTCVRQSNAQWDPYRSDCSGFVSWAWELPAPGLVTGDFAPIGSTDSTTIPCTDMKPGDAANRYPSTGHMVLFKEWITPGAEAIFMEEPGCSSPTPYAHEFQSAVTCSGSTVDITYEGESFTAIRYTNIVDDPVDAGSSGSGSSSGGSIGSSSGSSGGSSGSSSGSSGGGSGSSSGAVLVGDDAGTSGGSAPGTAAPTDDAGTSEMVPLAMPTGGAPSCSASLETSGGWPGGRILLAMGLAGVGLARRERRQSRGQ